VAALLGMQPLHAITSGKDGFPGTGFGQLSS